MLGVRFRPGCSKLVRGQPVALKSNNIRTSKMAAITTELIAVDVDNPGLIVTEKAIIQDLLKTEDGLMPIVKQVEALVLGHEADLTTKKGRDKTVSFAAKVAKAKVLMEGHGKELVEPLKAQTKVIDANRKAMKEAMDELRDKARSPVTKWEIAEVKRLKEIQGRIESIRSLKLTGKHSSVELDDTIKQLERLEITEEAYEEYTESTKAEVTEIIQHLRTARDERAEAEKEQARLEAEKAKLEAEKKAALEEQKARDEAAEKERQAEQKKLDEDRKRLEAEKKALADEKAKLKAEQDKAEAEKRRKATEAEIAAKAKEKKASHVKREEEVHDEIKSTLAEFIANEDEVYDVLEAIKAGEIPHISITY